MRWHFLIFLGCNFFAAQVVGQSAASLTMDVSTTAVRAGDPFDVKFVVKDSKNGKFIPPDFGSAGFGVLNTSQSSSFALSDGISSSTAVYKYQIMARDTGQLEIPAAILKMGATEIRTTPKTIQVTPGDGRVINPPLNEHPATPSQDPKKKIKTIRL